LKREPQEPTIDVVTIPGRDEEETTEQRSIL